MNPLKNKFQILLIVLLSGSCSSVTQAQPAPHNENDYVLVFPKTGDGFAGNLIRIDPDSIVVFTSDFTTAAKKNIAKIILRNKRETARGFVIGSVLGTYAANLLVGTASGQTGSFLLANTYGGGYRTGGPSAAPLSIVGVALIGMLFGGGIGWLSDHGAESEHVFLFGGSDQDRTAQWEALEHTIDHQTPQRARLRLDVSGGLVQSRISHFYRDQARAEGLSIGNNIFSDPFFEGNSFASSPPDASDFNWLRMISANYTVIDHFEAGVAIASLGEPEFNLSKDIIFTDFPTPRTEKIERFEQRYSGVGWYATATYFTRFGADEEFEGSCTAGLGAAKINFDLTGHFELDSDSVPGIFEDYNTSVHKTYLSGMLSAAISYYLYDVMSVGLSARYFFAGSVSAAGMPFLGIEAQKLNFGNADIGLTIGLHL